MNFEYEITADEYVAAQLLYYKQSGGRKRVEAALSWILIGSLFIFSSWNERVLKSAPILLAMVGVWWIYAGLSSLFPAWHFRRAYKGAELAGKMFKADVNEDGFEVRGEFCSWRVQWPGVPVKGENEHVFILFSEGRIFIFGKKYLNAQQQQELRALAGLRSSDLRAVL